MSYIDDLTYRVLQDGYDNSFPVRKSIKFVGGFLRDDEPNDRTLVGITSGLSQNLQVTCDIGNAAYNKITNLYTCTNPQDAANKEYVDSRDLGDILSVGNSTEGYNINFTGNSYLYSSDGYVIINDVLNMNSNIITNVSTPVSDSDAVNKEYVDNLVSAQGLPEVLAINNKATGYDINLTGQLLKEVGTIQFDAITLGSYKEGQVYFDSATKSLALQVDSISTLVGSGTPTDGYYLRGNGTKWVVSDFDSDVIELIGETGTVNGPGSSTDNAIVRWDGTTGTLIQNSLSLVDDSGNITIPNGTSLKNLNSTGTEVEIVGLTATNAIILGDLNNNAGMTVRTGGSISFCTQGSAISKMSLSTALTMGVHINGNGYSHWNLGYGGTGTSSSAYGYGYLYESTGISTYLNGSLIKKDYSIWESEAPRTGSNTLSTISAAMPSLGQLKFVEKSVDNTLTYYDGIIYQTNSTWTHS